MTFYSFISVDATPPIACPGDWPNFTGPVAAPTLANGSDFGAPVGTDVAIRITEDLFVLGQPRDGVAGMHAYLYSSEDGDTPTEEDNITFNFTDDIVSPVRGCVLDRGSSNLSGGGDEIVRVAFCYVEASSTSDFCIITFAVNVTTSSFEVGTTTTTQFASGALNTDSFDLAYNGLSGSSSQFIICWSDTVSSELKGFRVSMTGSGTSTATSVAALSDISIAFIPKFIRAGWHGMGIGTDNPPGQLMGTMCVATIGPDGNGSSRVYMIDPTTFTIDDTTTYSHSGNDIVDFDITDGLQGDSESPSPGDNVRYVMISQEYDAVADELLTVINSIGSFNGVVGTSYNNVINTETSITLIPSPAYNSCRITSTNDDDSNIVVLYKPAADNSSSARVAGSLLLAPGSSDISSSASSFSGVSFTSANPRIVGFNSVANCYCILFEYPSAPVGNARITSIQS